MWRGKQSEDNVLVINAQRLATAVIDSQMGEVEICVKAGVAHQTFAKMLKGQIVRFPSIGRICKVLNVAPAEIIREVPDETLQAQGQSVLVPPSGGNAHKLKDDPQGPSLAAVRRTTRLNASGHFASSTSASLNSFILRTARSTTKQLPSKTKSGRWIFSRTRLATRGSGN